MPITKGLIDFLAGLRGQWSASDDRDLLVLDSLAEMQEALTRLARSMPLEPDPEIRFLSNYPQPLVEQLAAIMGGGTLHVAAPYFGGSVAAVEELRKHLRPKKTRVYPAVHGDETLDVPLKKLGATPGVSAHRLALGRGRFAHLKLYGAEKPGGCWLFTTSANCTVAALSGENVEAGLLRAVNKATLRSYFAEDDGNPLPAEQRTCDFTAAARWLPLCAADRGAYIELIASGGVDLRPLRDVEVTVAFGGERYTVSRPSLFAGGAGEHVSWDLFPHATRRTNSPPLLSLHGKSPAGADVEGAAFVDQPLHLTSDPTHRSAWRATLALLDSEGHPDGADLACVFHLLGEVFETPTATPPASQGGTGGSHDPEPVTEDRLAIWPPVTHAALPVGFRHGHSHPVQWFQKILAGLMGPRSTESSQGDGSGGPSGLHDDEADDENPAPPPSRAAVSLWEYASKSFVDLLDRLKRMEPRAETAQKVWPVSIAILLVALATRRQLARSVRGLTLPDPGDLVDRFLIAAFGNRSQPWRHRMSDVDGRATHESVAAELHARFSAVPSRDIADVLLLLFAQTHARSPRHLDWPLLNGWLVFREVSPDHRGGAPPAGSETLYHRYLGDGAGVTWEKAVASLAALPRVGWSNHPGFRDYHEFASQAAADAAGERRELPEHLREEWEHTRRRVRLGGAWRHVVKDPFRPYCTVGCRERYRVDAYKKPLAEYAPVTCRGCGAVLVPERLLREYEARHARSS